MIKKILPLLATCLVLNHAFAADGCTAPKTSYDKTFCTAKLFMESDSELNAVYKKLMGFVKGDVKKNLVQAQRNWIHFRDNSCSQSTSIDVDCNFKVNKDRITFLEDRARECKTGHCQNDSIVTQDFKTTQ